MVNYLLTVYYMFFKSLSTVCHRNGLAECRACYSNQKLLCDLRNGFEAICEALDQISIFHKYLVLYK